MQGKTKAGAQGTMTTHRGDPEAVGFCGIPWRAALVIGVFVLFAGITAMAVIGESEQRQRVHALEREIIAERARVIEAQQLTDHFINALAMHKAAMKRQAATIAQLKRGAKE
jgi:CHASE1-domain containing sensor protein